MFYCRALNLTGKTRRCLNLGSYNYLGFAAADEYCTLRVRKVLREYGCGMCSSRIAAGIHASWLATRSPNTAQLGCNIAPTIWAEH